MNLNQLPSEITLKILSYLDCQGLTRTAQTSKWMKIIAEDDLLWKERIWTDYGLDWEEQGWDDVEDEGMGGDFGGEMGGDGEPFIIGLINSVAKLFTVIGD